MLHSFQELLPESVATAVDQLSDEQKTAYLEVRAKYEGQTASVLSGDQVAAMYEELRRVAPRVYEVLWPQVVRTTNKLARLDEDSRAFYKRVSRFLHSFSLVVQYTAEAYSLSSTVDNSDDFVGQVLKFAAAEWAKLTDESKTNFRREYPQLAEVFEGAVEQKALALHFACRHSTDEARGRQHSLTDRHNSCSRSVVYFV